VESNQVDPPVDSRVPLANPGRDEAFLESSGDVPFQATLGQSIEASYDLASMDTTTNSIANLIVQRKLDEQGYKKLQPDELNKMFPGMAEPFNEPMSQVQAEIISERNQERQRLNFLAGSGPQGFGNDALRFGAAMARHSIDPTDAILGLGVGKLLSLAVRGSKLAAAFGKTATRGQRLAVDIGEGVAGNVAAEPFVYYSNRRDHQEYTAEQSFVNAVSGAVGFAALKHGVGKGIDILKRMGPESYAAHLRAAGSHAVEGKRIDVDSFVNTKAVELGGDGVGYTHVKKGDVELSSAPVYIGSKINTNNIDLVETSPLSKYTGDGIYITDNKQVANNVASSSFEGGSGGVLEVNLKDVKTVDLDIAPDVELRARIQEATEIEMKDGQTLGQYIDDIRGEDDGARLTALNEALQSQGVDGYRWTGDNFEGVSHAANNQMMLFNKDKLEVGSRESGKISEVSRLSDEKLTAKSDEVNSYKSDNQYEPEFERAFDENLQQRFPEDDAKSLESEIDSWIEEAEELNRQGGLDAESRAELDSLRAEQVSLQTRDEMSKAAAVCFSGGA